jgi:hypothetical protein
MAPVPCCAVLIVGCIVGRHTDHTGSLPKSTCNQAEAENSNCVNGSRWAAADSQPKRVQKATMARTRSLSTPIISSAGLVIPSGPATLLVIHLFVALQGISYPRQVISVENKIKKKSQSRPPQSLLNGGCFRFSFPSDATQSSPHGQKPLGFLHILGPGTMSLKRPKSVLAHNTLALLQIRSNCMQQPLTPTCLVQDPQLLSHPNWAGCFPVSKIDYSALATTSE